MTKARKALETREFVGRLHRAGSNDCFTSLAAAFGLNAESLWQHARNDNVRSTCEQHA